jgi:hypothetical protein
MQNKSVKIHGLVSGIRAVFRRVQGAQFEYAINHGKKIIPPLVRI